MHSEDAQALVSAAETAQANDVVCAIAENFRIEDIFVKCGAQFGIDTGLGDLLEIQWAAFVHMPPETSPCAQNQMSDSMCTPRHAATPGRQVSEYNGGMIMDAGVHTAAALRVLAGGRQVDRVSAFVSRKGSHLPKIDTVASILRFTQ
ncbi:hypothetical protein SARC_15692, partial [Sphaeroforma arctica JP610]